MDRLLAQMSAREFVEWQAFERIEPFLSERVEFMLAQLTALVFNVNRKRNSQAKSARDFLLDTRTPEERRRQESALIQAETTFRQVRDKTRVTKGSGVATPPHDGSGKESPGHHE